MARRRHDPDRYRLGPGVAVIRAHVDRPGGGWWHIMFRDPARRPVRKSRALRTQDAGEALARAQPIYARYLAGVFDPWRSAAVTVPLEDARDRYLAHLAAQGRKPSHVHSQKQRLAWLVAVAGDDAALDDVTSDTIATVLRSGPKGPRAPATRYSLDRSLRAFFNWTVASGVASKNPMEEVPRVKPPRTPPRYLTAAQLEAVKRAAPAWLADAITVAALTGLRAGELAALTWADVDLRGGWITVRRARWGRVVQTPKGAGGAVPILPDVRAVLEELGPGEPTWPVLRGNDGRGLVPALMSRRFREAARLAKLPAGLSLHSLRHTYASHLVMGGADIYTVRDLLRQRDVTTTQRYAHLSPSRVADVAGAALAGLQSGMQDLRHRAPGTSEKIGAEPPEDTPRKGAARGAKARIRRRPARS